MLSNALPQLVCADFGRGRVVSGFNSGYARPLRRRNCSHAATAHTQRSGGRDPAGAASKLQDDLAASAARSRNNLAKRSEALRACKAVGAFGATAQGEVGEIKEDSLNDLIAERAAAKQASKVAARAAAANYSAKSSNFESKGRKAADCREAAEERVVKPMGGAQKGAGEEVRGATHSK